MTNDHAISTLPSADSDFSPARTSVRRRVWGAGLIGTELRTSLPFVATLFAPYFIAAVVIAFALERPPATGDTSAAIALLLLVFGSAIALIAGVLCGAADAESGMEVVASLLPIPRRRIQAEKIAGAILVTLLGYLLLYVAEEFFFRLWNMARGFPSLYPPAIFAVRPAILADAVMAILSIGAVSFAIGLAAGVWTRRVLLAMVLGIILAIAIWVYSMNMPHRELTTAEFMLHHPQIFGVPLALALIRMIWPSSIRRWKS